MTIHGQAYGAYGERTVGSVRAAFTGEAMEIDTGWYALSARLYAPALRRFLSVDAVSPFGDGGLNRYAYCGGDPVNRVDPSGHASWNWLLAGPGTMASLLASMLTPALTAIDTASSVVNSIASSARRFMTAIFGGLAPRMDTDLGNTSYLGAATSHQGRTPSSPITIITEPGHRQVVTHASGRRFIQPEWHERPMPLDGGETNSHWVADAAVAAPHVGTPLHEISSRTPANATTDVYVYMGVHGSTDGGNWYRGRRADSEPWNARALQTLDRFRGMWPNLNVRHEDIAGISESTLRERMRRPGAHVHAFCYSAVDPVVTSQLNMTSLPIYRLP